MAKPNYSFAKRQRDLEKEKKKEEIKKTTNDNHFCNSKRRYRKNDPCNHFCKLRFDNL